MNLQEGLTRRDFLTVAGLAGLGFITGACTRPEAKPPPLVLPTGAAAPTPRPTEILKPTPQPPPTETPKPLEKGVMGNWRFIPLSAREVPGLPPLKEGYKRLGFLLAVQNLSSQLKDDGNLDFRFKIRAAGDFEYPAYWYYQPSGLKIPPGYKIQYSTGPIDVPAIAKDLKLVGSPATLPKPSDGSLPVTPPPGKWPEMIWDIEKDFPPPGQERKIEYRPQDNKNLKQLGELLQQGPLSITPLKSILVPACTRGIYNNVSWNLAIQYQIENNYGYDLENTGTKFIVFDTNGKTWSEFIKSTWIIPKLAPGMTKVFYKTGVVSFGPSAFENACSKENTLPKPQQLQLLVWLPELSIRGTEETWAIYDLGDPASGPYLTNLYGFGEEDAKKFFEQVK